jgi:toxin ParE1/3/4
MKVIVSAKAYGDLQRIYLFCAEQSRPVAETVLAELNTRFGNLADFPFLGRPWPRLGRDVRKLTVGRHLVYYRAEADAGSLVILRVLDGRMDVESELLR